MGDVFPYGRDTVSHDILFFDHGWSTVRMSGMIPLWNHHLFAGWPWVAAAGWTPWYPPHWLALVFPTAFAFTAQYVLHHLWAGLGFTLWGLRLGFGLGPALLAGVMFQMSGHFTTLVHPGHLAKFEAVAWIPWVLAMAHPALKQGSRRHAVLAALCFAAQVLTQHAQIVYYAAAMLVAFALWRQARVVVSEKSLQALRPLRFMVAIGALGAAIAAVQLLPAMEMIRVSNRAEGVSWEEAIETSYPPEELAELAWPGLFGSSVDGDYRGRWGERLVSDYLGVVVLVGMLLALGRAVIRQMQIRGRPQRAWSLLALIALTLVLALGGHTPVYRVFYDWVPGWDRWRSPATIMCVTTFACCTFAGMGWTAVLNRGLIRVRHLGTVFVVLLILGAAADQTRVARKYVRPTPDSFSQMAIGIQLQFGGQDTAEGRGFVFTQEMSNAPMLSRWPFPVGMEIITGYHPIVLNSYQRLFETLGYNNPRLHQMLGVTRWLMPNGMSPEPPYAPVTLRPSLGRWQRLTLTEGAGEGVWIPEVVSASSDQLEALEALRAAANDHGVFSSVGIVGIGPGAEQSTTTTLLGSERMRPFAVVRAAGPYPQIPRARVDARLQTDLRLLGSTAREARINRLTVMTGIFPSQSDWAVVSQLIAPGWRVWGVPEDSVRDHIAQWGRDLRHTPEQRREIHPAWGVLWAIHLEGDEVLLWAEYRPATVRLGLFITLTSLALAIALLIRWRRMEP